MSVHKKRGGKVLVLAFGDRERSASTIYRVAQYEKLFAEIGTELTFFTKQKLDLRVLEVVREHDVVLNQKCLVNTWLGRMIAHNAKRLVFDLDDPMWTRHNKLFHPLKKWQIEKRLEWWSKASDLVLVANSYIADHIIAAGSTRNVVVLPMSLDLDIWAPRVNKPENTGCISIGWAGSPAGFSYLETIAPILREIKKKHPTVKLSIYSGGRPNIDCEYDYTPFVRGTEHEFVRNLDVGLLPLADEESAWGKSPIKAIQYIACGVPVIGNIVGATKDILSPLNSIAVRSKEDWVAALDRLILDKSLRSSLGHAGREHARLNFDRMKIGHMFVNSVLGIHDPTTFKMV
jgi:glycosyltransferase involved in cell wall biosynthesis